MMDETTKEDIAWHKCEIDDLWVFHKLILAKKLGYRCGPKGIDVPKSGDYIIRPCVNIVGMGVGAEFVYLEKNTESIPDGFFWCEIFKGRHLSTDYHFGVQSLCVEGKRSSNNLMKWDSWEKVDDIIPFPEILKNLSKSYEWVNVETIGGKIIEVHLRRNPDFLNIKTSKIIPIWKEDICPKGYKFIEDSDFEDRIGFCVKED